ncbi:MAG: hypothetical protein ABEJ70_04725 [Halobacteriaceae archaeon]
MAEPPEFWAFLLGNAGTLVVGGALSLLSFRAYLRTRHRSLELAAAGFGFITVGTLVEVGYELGIRGSFDLSGRELLTLHTVESLVIMSGLVVIFYALSRY